MQTVDFHYLKELFKSLWDFLWSGKVHRVSKNICIQPKISGGLGMLDIHAVTKVKRIQWITRLLKTDEMESWAWLPLKYIKSFDDLFDIRFLFYRQIIPENWWKTVVFQNSIRNAYCIFKSWLGKENVSKTTTMKTYGVFISFNLIMSHWCFRIGQKVGQSIKRYN